MCRAEATRMKVEPQRHIGAAWPDLDRLGALFLLGLAGDSDLEIST